MVEMIYKVTNKMCHCGYGSWEVWIEVYQKYMCVILDFENIFFLFVAVAVSQDDEGSLNSLLCPWLELEEQGEGEGQGFNAVYPFKPKKFCQPFKPK